MNKAPDSDSDFPWWLVLTGGIGLWLFWLVRSNDIYAQVLDKVSQGIWVTIFVTLMAFAIAACIGLVVSLGALSKRLALRQTARFYVEIVRGVPALVLLFYIAFVVAPAGVAGFNALAERIGIDPIRTRDISLLWRAILALAIAYSPFIAEVFRAGFLSVDHGMIEAAQSLGLNRWQRFRLIVFPQAIRTVLPPLGNDFIALVKDSSLVSVLGVADITQLGKVYAAGNFRYFETYNIVAYVYLVMTISLSLALRALERRMRRASAGE